MKVNEEIDAARVLGLSPVNLLVLPRVLALLVSLPILTFLAMIAGILGGALVCALHLNISPVMFPAFFMTRSSLGIFCGDVKGAGVRVRHRSDRLPRRHEGKWQRAIGWPHTTASVVHSIFVVILLDSVAALFFMEMEW